MSSCNLLCRGFAVLALLGLAGCADMSTAQRSVLGAVGGVAVAGAVGASMGWGATIGVAGGLLSGYYANSGTPP
ncbi:MAG: hypothetical protein AAGH83_05725 [Pseudomonadota bacterium]